MQFDSMVGDSRVVSTREVLREIEDGAVESLRDWSLDHKDLFPSPTAAESVIVKRIYAIQHFQQNIEQQKLLKGGRNADPFVVARAAVEGRTVVTMEVLRPNSAKIPNICRHFGLPCIGLEEFMERERWQF
jgi:hypothetical protein